MCGRFSNAWPRSRWEVVLGARQWDEEGPAAAAEFAPGDWIWVWSEPRRVRAMRWGWRMDWLRGRLLINARVEALGSRPSFRPYLGQRGLVLADAFYEWQHPAATVPASSKGRAVPYRVAPAGGGPLLLAALWREENDGSLSTVILTEPMAPALSWLHDREPVPVSLSDASGWLSRTTPIQALVPQLRQGPREWEVEAVEGSSLGRRGASGRQPKR